MDWLKRDLGIALRRLGRDRAFTLTAGLTLALCLGADTALFSIVHHIVLRPLPVPEADRLVMMRNLYPGAGAVDSSNSGVPDYYDRLNATSVYEAQALFSGSDVSLGLDGAPVRIRVMNATPSFFAVMKVKPALGRPFTEAEGELGHENKVVLGDALWRSRFGADPGVVGREIRLDDRPYQIVGVMPASFGAMDPRVQLWRALAFSPEQKSDERRHSNNYWNVARLKPGATREQAQAQIDALNAANLERFPQYKEVLTNAGFHTSVDPLGEYLVRNVKPTLYLLWGGATFVLLIGCVNVANLVLVRARARLKELATRLALGASHAQIARQLVIENLMLTLAAGGAGLLVAAAGLRAIGAFDLSDLPHGTEIALDTTATLYALGLAFLIGLGMGCLPIATVPASIAGLLREEGRGSSGGRGAQVLRRSLVVAQVAFTFVLLVGAGLLLASFRHVLDIDPGFDPRGVHTASVMLPRERYPDADALRRFTEASLARLAALPGVAQAGATDTIPFGGRDNDSVILAEGYTMKPGESVVSPNAVDVSPGYFEAMGARLVKGRFFTAADTKGALPVLVVDERLAARFWPGQDPIGKRLYLPEDINNLLAVNEKTVFLTVVGVVRNLELHDLTEGDKAVGTYFYPLAQDASRLLTFALKAASGDADSVAASLRAAIHDLDPELPLFDAQSMEQRTDKALLNRRSPALLSASFGALALLLSAVGLYGVLAYLVTQRTKEIGIRMALGSSARAIFDLVLGEGLRLLGSGFVVGALGAFALRGSLQSQLFRVGATDPAVIGVVTVLLGVVAFVASAIPARRATRIDPQVALTE
jgi:predicted permease